MLALADELTDAERAEVADELLHGLRGDASSGEGEALHAEWIEELDRRVEDLRTGRVQPVSHEDALAQLRSLRAELGTGRRDR